MLEVKNLCISYGKKATVKNVSFAVRTGQIVGLVGESGSGKSTVVRSILGILPSNGKVTSGDVTFQGERLIGLGSKDWRKIRGRKISMIFQHPGNSLNPVMTVGAQFCECMKVIQGTTKVAALEKAGKLLEELHLSDPQRVLKSYPFELSGGMCQRVAIALAMANNPDLLLADEPTSALDVTVQAQTIDVMMELREKYGAAILLVTHNMGVIAHMADMVGVMYQGELVEWGTRKEILGNPIHPYTKALIRAIPSMNGKLPESIPVSQRMPYTVISETHWAGTGEEQNGKRNTCSYKS